MLAVHREGHGAREVFREDPLILWTSQGSRAERYVAAFNTGEDELAVSLDSQDVGLPAMPEGEVRELWSGEIVPARAVSVQSDEARGVAPGSSALDVRIPRHGAALLGYPAVG